MKRIFNKKKSQEDVLDNVSSKSVDSDSLKSLKISKDNDTISKSFQYSYNSNTNSLFSSERSARTGLSSNPSSLSYSKNVDKTNIIGIGRPLRVLREDEHEDEDESEHLSQSPVSQRVIPMAEIVSVCSTEKSFTSNLLSSDDYEINEFIKQQLKILSGLITNILIQISQSVINLTRASISITELMIKTCDGIKGHKSINMLLPNQFNTSNCDGLHNVIKNILHILDNSLNVDVYNKSKALILKNLYDLFALIKVVPNEYEEITNFIADMSPKVYPVGSTLKDMPHLEKANRIMNNLMEKSNLLSDQEGAFIAPVMRGFETPELSVITFMFGFPEISKEHLDVIKYFATQTNEFHYLAVKNSIKPCSGMTLKSPFRTIDDDQDYIPVSMSLSTNTSTNTSGTLGGYLYPKVPANCLNSKLLKYKGQIFGLTCAHVVLNNGNESNNNENNHPDVSVPSPALINMYKNALLGELNNYSNTTPEYYVFNDAIENINKKYPERKIIIKNKEVRRNLPEESLGKIIWGERLISDNKLSDVAIIKVNERLKSKKFTNYLGEDLQLSQYDPTLILSNLNIRSTISLKPRKNGLLSTADLKVFKVGSTTGYTCGRLNGMKMIYWSDGSLRSNEFVINNNENGKSEMFANGGDSGAFIVSKMNDVHNIMNCNKDGDECNDEDDYDDENERRNYNNDNSCKRDGDEKNDDMKKSLTSFIESFIPGSRKNVVRKDKTQKKKKCAAENGLGVLGMLHSYDGEFKQFGLFTPMNDILDRLEVVTNIKWGIVGSGEDNEYENDSVSLSSYEDEFVSSNKVMV